MKYVKMLGLAAIAAAALMAFVGVGTASATELTSPAGTMLGPGTVIHAESVGHAILHPPIGDIECASTVEGTTTNTGGAGVAVTGHITHLTFTGCTRGAVVTVLNNGTSTPTGTLTITGTSGNVGDVTSNGTEVTVEAFGFHCIFKTSNTPIGTLTGGSPATFDISAKIPRTGGRSGIFCGGEAEWTGTYKITKPNPLIVDP